MSAAEQLARRFHELYEELAPFHGYETRKASAVPWEDVPANNKSLMIQVAARILAEHAHQPREGAPAMAATTATIGRIVQYCLSDYDAAQISADHTATHHRAGDVVAAVIVRVWSDDLVNLRLLLDAPGELPHLTSRGRGDQANPVAQSQWRWPDRV